MKKIPKNFENKRKLLLELNSNQLTKNILYHINEARSSPREFSHHLIIENDEDNKLNHLYTFLKFYSKEVPPLILDKNLEICSKDLLQHLISIDNGSPIFNYSEENKMRNSLRIRLKRLNLIPTYYVHFLIIGAQNSIDAIINLLLNIDYRNKILSPDMHYIGIASGLLPSENLCIIIDIVNAIKINNIFNLRPVKYSFYNYNDDDDYENECDYNFYENYNKNDILNNYTNNDRYFYQNYSCKNMKPKTDKKAYNMKRIYNSVGYTPYKKKKVNININNNCIRTNINRKKYKNYFYDDEDDGEDDSGEMDLRITGQKSFNPNVVKFKNSYYEKQTEFKLPVSISIDKKYKRNKDGRLYPFYFRQTKYDDGSILIQPDFEDDENDEYL
jgi:hypothetical protein